MDLAPAVAGGWLPVLTMGAAAAACAALWLRHRAPARDADALGALGHPAWHCRWPGCSWWVARWANVPAGRRGRLAGGIRRGRDRLLRRAIHVGLLEESSETPIGAAFTCPNCGHLTARHTFCGHCGISLQALPKPPGRTQPVGGEPVHLWTVAGDLVVSAFAERRASRVSTGSLGGRILHVFVTLFLLLIGFSVLTNVLVGPSTAAPCSSGQPCGAPPSVPAVIRETARRSSQYGFSLDYPGSVARVSRQAPGRLVLATNVDGHSGTVVIQGFPAGTDPSQAIGKQVSGLKGLSQLAPDGNPAHQLLGAGVGYLSGAGRAYVGASLAPGE